MLGSESPPAVAARGHAERGAQPEDHHRRDEPEQPGDDQPGAPAGEARDAVVDHDRRQEIAAGAAEAVDAVGAAEALRPHLRGQDRQVGRMEDAVAERRRHRERQQHPIGGRQAHQQHRDRHGRDAEQHQPVAAVAVDQDADEGLAGPGHAVEQRDDQAERRIAHGELVAQQREQRPERDLVKVRQHVGEPDQADYQGVGADLGRCRGSGIACGHAGNAIRNAAPFLSFILMVGQGAVLCNCRGFRMIDPRRPCGGEGGVRW